MKLNHYADTDSLYLDLLEQPSVESREVSEGVVVDYDVNGNLVGIDIDRHEQRNTTCDRPASQPCQGLP